MGEQLALASSLALGSSLSSAPFWFWWLAPVAVTLLVGAMVAWLRRDRGPRHQSDAVEEYARFRAAMAHVRSTQVRSSKSAPGGQRR